MSEQETVDMLMQGMEAFRQGNLQSILDIFSDDVDFQHPMIGKLKGLEQLAEFITGMIERVKFEKFEPLEIIAQGDKVVIIIFEKLRIKANGCSVDNEYVQVFTVKGKKVVQWRVYEDTAPIVKAYSEN